MTPLRGGRQIAHFPAGDAGCRPRVADGRGANDRAAYPCILAERRRKIQACRSGCSSDDRDQRSEPGRNAMRRALIAVLIAGALAVSTTKPAEARWGWGGGAGGGGWGGGTRRLRRRRTAWRGAVAASLLLLLSGLRLWVRLSGLQLRLRLSVLLRRIRRRILRRLRRILRRLRRLLPPVLCLPASAAVVTHRACSY